MEIIDKIICNVCGVNCELFKTKDKVGNVYILCKTCINKIEEKQERYGQLNKS